MNKIIKYLPLIFVIIASFFTIIPLFNQGFFVFHDNIQVQRVFEMTKALRDGMFPVRWSEDLGFGFGYPMFNYYAPLSYYIAGFWGLLGISALVATKIIIAMGVIFSASAMYLFVTKVFNKKAGMVAAIVYAFAPYHALDIFVRGDIAETWAYIFIPLVFYSLYKIYKEEVVWGIAFGALSYAGLIMSHNLTALMASPFIFGFILVLAILKKNKKLSSSYLLALGLGVCISAFYWVPMLAEMNYTNVISQVGGGADYKDHFVCLMQLWTSSWGFGGSTPGCIDGLSFMIGKLHIIMLLVSILLFAYVIKVRKISKEYLIMISFFIFSSFFCVFLMLDYSRFLWDFLHPMAFFQYPWRFLILIVFFISFIAGSGIFIFQSIFKKIRQGYLIVFVAVICLGFVIFNLKFFYPQQLIAASDKDYTNNLSLNWISSRISSEYMPKGFSKPNNTNELAGINLNSKDVKGKILIKTTNKLEIRANLSKDQALIVPIAFFPAWKVEVDGKSTQVIEDKRGIKILMRKGEHHVVVRFSQTPIEVFSNLLSIAGILLLIVGIIVGRNKYEKVA